MKITNVNTSMQHIVSPCSKFFVLRDGILASPIGNDSTLLDFSCDSVLLPLSPFLFPVRSHASLLAFLIPSERLLSLLVYDIPINTW